VEYEEKKTLEKNEGQSRIEGKVRVMVFNATFNNIQNGKYRDIGNIWAQNKDKQLKNSTQKAKMMTNKITEMNHGGRSIFFHLLSLKTSIILMISITPLFPKLDCVVITSRVLPQM
jgi:uncharacterized membrane protein